MVVRSVTLLAAAIAASSAVFAQGDNTVRINGALEGDKLPFRSRTYGGEPRCDRL